MTKIKKELNEIIYDYFETNQDKTQNEIVNIINYDLGKTWTKRTYVERYKNFKQGIKKGMEDTMEEKQLKRIAKAQSNVMVQRKVNTLMKHELNKTLKQASIVELAKEQIDNALGKDLVVDRTKVKPKKNKKKIEIEYSIADWQYDGHKASIDAFGKVQNMIVDDMKSHNAKDVSNVRVSFLGDDIEGVSAHKSQLLQVKVGAIEQTLDFANFMSQVVNNIYDNKPKEWKMDVAYVPSSNHGETRPQNSKRGEFPKEDFGYIIEAFFQKTLNKDIYMWESKDGLIYTNDSIYLHGHQGFAKTKLTLTSHFGVTKNIIMGHFHHLKVTQLDDNLLIVVPMVMQTKRDYSIQAGYKSQPGILKLTKENGKIVDIKLMRFK